MIALVKIAVRNLARYRRRSVLTASLIAIGVIMVVVFGAAAGAFKSLMVGQMTDAMLGHLQIHRRGYVASIDNLPLTMMLTRDEVAAIEETLGVQPEVEAYSQRLKFGGMFSNYTETTAIRLNGVEVRSRGQTSRRIDPMSLSASGFCQGGQPRRPSSL